MNKEDILEILEKVESGEISKREAYQRILSTRYKEIENVLLDYERPMRTGFPEAIYAKGKSLKQIISIVEQLYKDKKQIIVTKLRNSQMEGLKELNLDKLIIYDEIGVATGFAAEENSRVGSIAVVTGGTSDYKIAEECAIIAEALGSNVTRIYDVGVAGIHRLISKLPMLTSANVIVTVAGMEGALASVVAGLVKAPVIAVPTSVGYGASFGGVSALLSMLNSCAPGISVVNIDNGFGAGYQANLINHLIERKRA